MAQNSFAYVGAINGSVGCALLLFVIPCAIDLKLKEHTTVKQPKLAAHVFSFGRASHRESCREA